MNIKTIAIEHSSFFFPFYALYTENFTERIYGYKNIDRLIVLSPILKKIWESLDIAKVEFIPNPLTFNIQNIENIETKKEKNLIFVGRICRMKGIFEALDVLNIVKNKYKNIKLYILGRFENEEMSILVKNRIKELTLDENIIFTGHIDNIDYYYNICSVHIMPSVIEGAPMSFFEAKSFGLPTVCFEIPTLYLANESNGCLMVGKQDVYGMAKAVLNLLDNENYWLEMSKKARESLDYVSDNIILERWNKLISDIYIDSSENIEKNNSQISHIILKEFQVAIDWYNKYHKYSNNEYLFFCKKDKLNKLIPKGSIRRKLIKKLYTIITQNKLFKRYKCNK